MVAFFIDILKSIISAIILGCLSILFFISTYKEHRKIYSMILKLKREFKDPNQMRFNLNVIEHQHKLFVDIFDKMTEIEDIHPIFAYLFDYKKIKNILYDLFEYNRNSIMLKDKKVYSSDYKMDYNKKFIKIKRLMNFQIKILIIFILVIIISFVVFTKLI